MRPTALIAFAFLAATSPSYGQAASQKPDDVKIAKEWACARRPETLIGLTSAELREKCGQWTGRNVTTTAFGQREQLIFSNSMRVIMDIYLTNDVVMTVQSR